MMPLPPGDQFHIGIVVDDFESARDTLVGTCGYVWGPDIQLEYTMLVPDGSITYQQRLTYSVTEPRLEIVQSVAGTPLQPTGSGLHHLGILVRRRRRHLSRAGCRRLGLGVRRRERRDTGLGVSLQPCRPAARVGEHVDESRARVHVDRAAEDVIDVDPARDRAASTSSTAATRRTEAQRWRVRRAQMYMPPLTPMSWPVM